MSKYEFNPQTGELSPKSGGNGGVVGVIGLIITIVVCLQMCG
jgi:hypothetical protein